MRKINNLKIERQCDKHGGYHWRTLKEWIVTGFRNRKYRIEVFTSEYDGTNQSAYVLPPGCVVNADVDERIRCPEPTFRSALNIIKEMEEEHEKCS